MRLNYFAADFICLKLKKMNFVRKQKSLFEPPFGGLRGNVRIPSIAHWKHVINFLFVIIELFSLSVSVETL